MSITDFPSYNSGCNRWSVREQASSGIDMYHWGYVSSHLMCRNRHVLHPVRDFLCVRRIPTDRLGWLSS